MQLVLKPKWKWKVWSGSAAAPMYINVDKTNTKGKQKNKEHGLRIIRWRDDLHSADSKDKNFKLRLLLNEIERKARVAGQTICSHSICNSNNQEMKVKMQVKSISVWVQLSTPHYLQSYQYLICNKSISV